MTGEDRGAVVPLFQPPGPQAVAATLAELRPGCAKGDGATMRRALTAARAWWQGYEDAARGTGRGEAPHLTDGWCDLFAMIAEAPAGDVEAVKVKAELAAWQIGENGARDFGWEGRLLHSLQAGLHAVLAQAEGAQHG